MPAVKAANAVHLFEYIATLVAFIVAFGVSRLLAGWTHQFNHRSEIEVYPLQVAASFLMLITLLQATWGLFLIRDIGWTFGTFLLMILAMLALVGAAALIQPPPEHRGSVRNRYFETRYAVFGLRAVWDILGGVQAVVLSHLAASTFDPAVSTPLRVILLIRAVALLPFAFLAWSDRPSHHWAGLAALALLQTLWVVQVTNSPAA